MKLLPPLKPKKYQIIYVKSGGRLAIAQSEEALTTQQMANFALRRDATCAIRFWPSKKGWRVLDLRNAQALTKSFGQRNYDTVVGARFLPTIFPSEDSAVMAARHLVTR